MKRYLGFFALALLIGVVATQTFVRGQDKVERRDKKGGSAFVSGKILEETPGGVKVKVQGIGKEEVIPSNEIVRVTYADLPIKIHTPHGPIAGVPTTDFSDNRVLRASSRDLFDVHRGLFDYLREHEAIGLQP